ncbi:MAG: hypothetical protein WCN95_01775 [bacterium]
MMWPFAPVARIMEAGLMPWASSRLLDGIKPAYGYWHGGSFYVIRSRFTPD